jgi:hypothetical protein
MTEQQITDLVDELGDIATGLATADSACKADLYRKLGLHLTYDPANQVVQAETRLNPRRIGGRFVSEAGGEPSAYIVLPLGNVQLNVAALVDDESVED